MLSPTYEITTALSHTDELISPPYDIAIVTISYGRVIMSSVWDSMMSKKNVGWPFYAAVHNNDISATVLPEPCHPAHTRAKSRQSWKVDTGCLLDKILNTKCCCLLGKTPAYLSQLPTEIRDNISSHMSKTALGGFPGLCFVYVAPSLWYHLPTIAKCTCPFVALQRSLKTCRFNLPYFSIHWLICTSIF